MQVVCIFVIGLLLRNAFSQFAKNYKPKPEGQMETHENEEAKMFLLDFMFNRTKYDKRIRPIPTKSGINSGGATAVAVDLYVRGISSIDEINMEFTMDLLVRQNWNDPRLSYAHLLDRFDRSRLDNFNFKFIKCNEQMLKHMWVPDLFFANEKKAFFHTVTVPNIMIRVTPEGDVLYSTRFSMVVSCDMDLRDYPFDTQDCIMQLGSFSYTERSVKFQWSNGTNSVKTNSYLRLPKYNLTGWQTIPCLNKHYTGVFSCLKLQLTFNRELGFHLVQSYLPSVLLVIASWIGFWLDVESVAARTTLGVTTLLTTTAQTSNIKQTLPPVSYTKAIDVWLGACTTFVFLAMIEFALCNYLSRWEFKRRRRLARLAERTARMQAAAAMVAEPLDDHLYENHASRPRRSMPFKNHPVYGTMGPPNYSTCRRRTRPNKDSIVLSLDRRSHKAQVSLDNAAFRMNNTDAECECSGPSFYGASRDSIQMNSDRDRLIPIRPPPPKPGRSQNTMAKTVDKISRMLFPTAFLMFLAAYAIMYPVLGRTLLKS